MKPRNLIILIVAAATCALSSCSTVRGVGKDVESTGEHIQRAAHR